MLNKFVKNGIIFSILLLLLFISVFPSSGVILENRYSYLDLNNNKSLGFGLNKAPENFLFSSENEVPGIYVFSPCYYINISGQGTIDKKEAGPVSFTVWDLINGHVRINLNNDVYEELHKINIHGTFLRFKGSLSENPVKITGEALYGLYIEESKIIKLSTNKDKYKRAENIEIITKNIDSSSINIENLSLSVYELLYGTKYQRIYSKSFNVTIKLEPGETFVCAWDQKDYNGKNIQYGEYILAGEFPIKGLSRKHTGFTGFIIRIFTGTKSHSVFNLPMILNKNYFQNHLMFNYLKLLTKNPLTKK